MRSGRPFFQIKEVAASKIKAYAAVSLRREFQPVWPLPLPPAFPRNAKKHVLLLDIDETLIHTFGMSAHAKDPNDKLLDGVELYEFHYLARPYLQEFLKEVMELFEVIFWTSGTASYCASILDSIEREVLGLPPSFYSYREIVKEMKGLKGSEGATNHANFYALSRNQTLQDLAYMKYIPMAGRKATSCILIDDNVRSFPLTPRSGIKIPPFDGDYKLIQRCLFATKKITEQKEKGLPVDPEMTSILDAASKEMERMEQDCALRDIMPLLRAVAKVPYDSDVRLELDHWRSPDYTQCDDFHETMNDRSVVRQRLLGEVTRERQASPIAAFKARLHNVSYIEAAKAQVQILQNRSLNRSKL